MAINILSFGLSQIDKVKKGTFQVFERKKIEKRDKNFFLLKSENEVLWNLILFLIKCLNVKNNKIKNKK